MEKGVIFLFLGTRCRFLVSKRSLFCLNATYLTRSFSAPVFRFESFSHVIQALVVSSCYSLARSCHSFALGSLVARRCSSETLHSLNFPSPPCFFVDY